MTDWSKHQEEDKRAKAPKKMQRLQMCVHPTRVLQDTYSKTDRIERKKNESTIVVGDFNIPL